MILGLPLQESLAKPRPLKSSGSSGHSDFSCPQLNAARSCMSVTLCKSPANLVELFSMSLDDERKIQPTAKFHYNAASKASKSVPAFALPMKQLNESPHYS
jgi:hypothetical protein